MRKTIMACLFVLLAAAVASAQEQTAPKINLIMDDGTLIIYAGASQGIAVGDEFTTEREGKQTGKIRIVRVSTRASYAQAIAGQPVEMDTLVPASKAAPAETVKKPVTPKPVEEASEPPAEEKPAKKSSSDAKAKKKETLEKKPKDSEESGDEPAAKKEKPAKAEKKPVPPPEEKKPQVAKAEGKTAAKPVTFHGAAGLLYVPTAEVMPANRGSVMIHFVNADDKALGYKDTGYGVAYGISRNVEASFVRVNTSPSDSLLNGIDLNTNIISFKYQFGAPQAGVSGLSMPKLKLPEETSRLIYAAGLTYYNMGSTTVDGGDGKVTRMYAVGTGRYDKGTVHVGIYNQSGNLIDGSDYDGIGFMGGIEWPLSVGIGMGKGTRESMSFIAEFDSKAYYLGTYRTPSIGLRYSTDMFSLTAGVLDVAETKTFTAGGTFNF